MFSYITIASSSYSFIVVKCRILHLYFRKDTSFVHTLIRASLKHQIEQTIYVRLLSLILHTFSFQTNAETCLTLIYVILECPMNERGIGECVQKHHCKRNSANIFIFVEYTQPDRVFCCLSCVQTFFKCMENT